MNHPPSRSGGGGTQAGDTCLAEILLAAALISLVGHYVLWRAVVWGWLL